MTKQGTKQGTRKHLTEPQWEEVKALWETGQYKFKALSELFGISINTVKHRSSKYHWTPKALRPAVQEKIREGTVDMLARLGLPKEEWLSMVIEGARETKCLKNIKSVIKDDTGKAVLKNDKPIVFDQTISAVDNEATFKYRDLIGKIAGWYHAPKASVMSDDGAEEDAVIPVVSHITPVKKPE